MQVDCFDGCAVKLFDWLWWLTRRALVCNAVQVSGTITCMVEDAQGDMQASRVEPCLAFSLRPVQKSGVVRQGGGSMYCVQV